MDATAPSVDRRITARELGVLIAGWNVGHGPAYRALADRLRLLVLDGRLPVHVRLPSERELGVATGTSRTTTTAAYRLLREEGFAAAGHGSGTWTALPGRGPFDPADPAGGSAVPWPVTTTGSRGDVDGRGDLSSAAPEAPVQVHAAYAAALTELPRYLPGHGYVTAGIPALRERIAARYTARGLPTTVEQVLVTAGAMHGLRLALAAVLSPGERVVAEHPTYPLALDAIRRAGGRPVPLPVEDGWDARTLAATLRSTGARLAYLMPDAQNPTGAILDDDGRRGVAAALHRAGCVAIVDETTADLDLRDVPVPGVPFPAVAPSTICLGSASKTFWGGLRIGWLRADPALVRRLTLARAADDLGSPVVEQLATAFLLDDVEAVLAGRRAMLRARRDALRAALARHLPEWDVPEPPGGMVLWCRLPVPRATALAGACRASGVTLTPGSRFAVGQGFEDRVRIPFARPEPELRAATALVAAAWRSGTGEDAAEESAAVL